MRRLGQAKPDSSSARECTARRSSSRHAGASIRARVVHEPVVHGINVLASEVGDHETLNPTRLMNRKLKGAHTLEDLCALVQQEGSRFSSVNLSHAFSRLAKLRTASFSSAAQHHQPTVSAAVQRLASEVPRTIGDFQAWDVALCLWSMSLLGMQGQDRQHAELFSMLCQRCSQLASEMNTADCAMVMLTFGRLKQMHPELLQRVAQVLMGRLESAKPQEISSVLWGFARLGPGCAPSRVFMEELSHHLAWTMGQYGGQELSIVLWSMATLGYRPKRAMLRAAEQRLVSLAPQLSAQDVGNSLWALGRMRYKAVELLDALPQHLAGRLHEFRPQEMSCLLFGYTHARHFHGPLLQAALPVLMSRAPYMSQQDVVVALWTYGIFARGSETGAEQAPSAAEHGMAWRQQHSHFSSSAAPVQAAAAAATADSHADSLDAPGTTSGRPSQPSSSQQALPPGLGARGPAAAAAGPGAEPGSLHPPTWESQSATAERLASSQGASTSAQAHGQAHQPPASRIAWDASGLPALVRALAKAVRLGDMHSLPPVALCNLVKALASLRAGGPEVQAVVTAAAKAAAARAHELRPDEMANLLYGLSLLRYNDLHVYYTCVVQLIRLLEGGGSMQPMQINHKVLNSIVHSCVSAGYTPWVLIECAEVRGIRLLSNPSLLTPRWSGSRDEGQPQAQDEVAAVADESVAAAPHTHGPSSPLLSPRQGLQPRPVPQPRPSSAQAKVGQVVVARPVMVPRPGRAGVSGLSGRAGSAPVAQLSVGPALHLRHVGPEHGSRNGQLSSAVAHQQQQPHVNGAVAANGADSSSELTMSDGSTVAITAGPLHAALQFEASLPSSLPQPQSSRGL